jgi:hypothetical protein
MSVYSIYNKKKRACFLEKKPFVAKILHRYYNIPNIFSVTSIP